MALETGNYIGDLVPTNPTSADPKSSGDDHFRLIKDALRKSFPGFSGTVLAGGTDTGTATAYVLTPATPLPAYSTNMVVVFKAANANTGATPTLNISGLGAKPIKDMSGADVLPGDIAASRYTTLVYDGTNFNLLAVTKNYVQQQAFNAALPAQAGNAGKALFTSGLTAGWETIPPPAIIRSGRTANTQLGADDRSNLIEIVSGTFTQTFAAAATLGNGWCCYIRNSGTGTVTLDPSAAETIDGLATVALLPGETRLVQCDGTTLRSIRIAGVNYQEFTASGTWVKPPGITVVYAEIINGGCSGSAYAQSIPAHSFVVGGAGGARLEAMFKAVDLPASVNVIVGAGGVARATSTSNQFGQTGGTSSFNGVAALANPTYDTVASGGYSGGGPGVSCHSGGAGGASINGSALSPGVSALDGNGGSASRVAGGGAATAQNGAEPGGGGGAASNDNGFLATSGAGAKGRVRVWAW